MTRSRPLVARLWLLVPVAAFGFLLATNATRIQRVDQVTAIAQEAETSSTSDGSTGFHHGTRQLIVPEHLSKSYGWITQTQQMLADGQWRLRSVDYDNAPQGRPVFSASAYRWWLAGIARVHQALTGMPAGQSVERAALYADPLLHALLLLALTWFARRQFGPAAAVTAALAAVALYPFGAGFLPGVPDDLSLLLWIAPWCVLPLVAGLRTRARCGFAWGGVAAGIALWVNVALAVPVIVGVAIGALAALGVNRTKAAEAAEGWRVWGIAGATTVLVTSLVEFYPEFLAEWEMRAVHPLYGLSWIGLGEALRAVMRLAGKHPAAGKVREGLMLLAGAAMTAAVPLVMWRRGNPGFLAPDLTSFRLTKQHDGIMAPNLPGWLTENAGTAAWATLLPVALVLLTAVVIVSLRSRSTAAPVADADAEARPRVPVVPAPDAAASAILSLGPVLVAAVLGYFHLRWWQVFGGLLIPLLVVVTSLVSVSPERRWLRAGWAGALAVVLLLGVTQVVPRGAARERKVLTVPEVEGLVERDLAHWLALRVASPGTPVVLAPPSVTSAVCYYGGFRGLASIDWENKEGLSVALRIVISTSREEALALIRKRGVTHIVIPSWDDFFAGYMGPASVQTGELFFASIDRWSLPTWLRPLPYQVPAIGGFEGQHVKVFAVVDDVGDAMAASRLAEYFVEMGQSENARLADELLRRYPADLGAWVARGQVYAALGDANTFAQVLDTIVKRLGSGGDRFLPWERRVSLASVLARGKRMDLARAQTERALKEITAERVRSLTPYALYHFVGLAKAFDLRIADSETRDVALRLLPAEMRDRVK